MSFGCAIDAGAHLGSFCESDVGFRSAEVQYGASTNAPESPPESAKPHDQFYLARSAFSGPVLFSSTPMPPWHHYVIDTAPIHLALFCHTSGTICGSVMIDFVLPRAELCCFSAKSDRCTGIAQRSDELRRCKLASIIFNTFARGVFFCLPRSYRVEEKSEILCSREPNYAVFQQNPTVAQA